MDTIQEIRRLNLRRLIIETVGHDGYGAMAEFGRRIDKGDGYVRQLKSSNRNMGAEFARDLEASCGKPRGWMDRIHIDGAADLDSHSVIGRLAVIWETLPPEDRRKLFGIIDGYLEGRLDIRGDDIGPPEDLGDRRFA